MLTQEKGKRETARALIGNCVGLEREQRKDVVARGRTVSAAIHRVGDESRTGESIAGFGEGVNLNFCRSLENYGKRRNE